MSADQPTVEETLIKARKEIDEFLKVLKQRQGEAMEKIEEVIQSQPNLSKEELEANLREVKRRIEAMSIFEHK